MNKELTCIVTIRNRAAGRVDALVRSIREHGANPQVLVIDYGSEELHSKGYEAVVHSLGGPIDYVKMRTEGWPWNKCHAINHGARIAQTDHVCTSDVDMVYASDPFTYCLENKASHLMFHIDTYWLGRDGRADKARPAGRGNPGGFQFLPKAAFAEAGGYDERMVYWGLEDLDWPERLKALGFEQQWLPGPHRIYHQWHPRSEGGHRRPETASFNTMSYCVENRLQPVLAQDWGRAITEADRPILEAMKKRNDPFEVQLPPNALMHYGNIDRLLDTRAKGRFVRLGLGERLIRRPLSSAAGITSRMLRPVTALTGLSCHEKINLNFDYLYAMLPSLLELGLEDHFISSDLSTVYLLWR